MDGDSEWWQKLAARARSWGDAHPVLVERLRRVRVIGLWVCLVWLLVLVIFRSELREALTVSFCAFWLLLAWFWLARTKTVPWRLVAGLYSVCMVWSIAVAFGTHALAQQVGARDVGGVQVPGRVADLGVSTLIAGVGEESAKLLPLAVLALLAAGRVRRLAAVDWLLLGFASGLAFQVSEELARRTAAHVIRPGLLDLIFGVDDRGPASGYAQYSLSPLGGWSQWTPGTQFPGHHVTTALVAASVALAIAAWRHAASRSSFGAAMIWRAGACLGPLVMWWLVVSVHAGGNATSAVQDQWLNADPPSMPWLIRTGWILANQGVGLRWVLPVLLLAALMLDARHLRAGDTTKSGPVLAVPFAPAPVAEAWTARLLGTRPPALLNPTAHPSPSPSPSPEAASASISKPGVLEHRWWRAFVESVVTLAAYLWRDLLFLLAAHAPDPDGSRRVGLARGRVAMEVLRQAREEGIARHLRQSRPSGRAGTRLLAVTAVIGLLVALVWLGPHWAYQVGNSPTARAVDLPGSADTAEWFARVLDALGQWWNGLSPAGKIAVGAGLAALVVLSGGSLGLALGLSGAGTYILGHSRGASTFVTNPGEATRSYLSHTTPLGVLADTGEAVLTFLPGNFAGAATGRFVRNGIDLYARNPEAWWAAQRTPARNDAGVIDLSAFLRRDPIDLADGTPWPALPVNERTAMRDWWESLPTTKLNATGPEAAYQAGLYGNTERVIATTPKKTIADGATIDYGAVADAKFRTGARSFYDPPSMSSPAMATFAQQSMDDRLAKYAAALADPSNPAKVLEIATNDPAVARFIEGRLRALNIPGYVRIEP